MGLIIGGLKYEPQSTTIIVKDNKGKVLRTQTYQWKPLNKTNNVKEE